MRSKVILACAECGSRNYTTESTSASKSERFEIKKHCKTCNAHTLHKETK
ncbi:50S ribosomal protein L33 [Peribacillus alkalitolerans]|nr:50S ribosomal protein L33 [Peribacillus alkalitolerans]